MEEQMEKEITLKLPNRPRNTNQELENSMGDYKRALDTVVSKEDWELMSTHAGVSASELKANIIPALEGAFGEGAPDTTAVNGSGGVKLGEVEQEGKCSSQSFEVTLFSIVGVRGK